MITPKTSGIIGVHLWGRPCDIHGLEKIAKKYSLKLLFDAAHAFGCTYGKKSIGGFGEIEVYSFHATKFFNTFEGGAVLTNNDDLAKKVRLMQNFGFGGLDKVIYIGTNGKMNEASAAMGLTSLENLDNILIKNKSNYFQYKQELENIPGIKLLEYPDYGKSNYQYVVLAINESESGLSRDEIMSILHHENVIARRYFYPGCHRMEPYRSFFPNAGLMLKETEKATERVLLLPTGTAIGKMQIYKICNLLKHLVNNSFEIKERLTQKNVGKVLVS